MKTIGLAFLNKWKQQQINGVKIEADKIRVRNKIKNKTGCMGLSFYLLKEYIIDCYLGNMDYTHCEISFMNERVERENTCLTFGVFSGEGVFENERTFSNMAYDWIFISVEDEKYYNMLQFCRMQVGKKYDINGMMALGIWPRKCPDGTWWCVPFVVTALQKGKMLTGYKPYTLDVDDIKNYFDDHPARTLFFSPQQLNDIEQNIDLLTSGSRYTYV